MLLYSGSLSSGPAREGDMLRRSELPSKETLARNSASLGSTSCCETKYDPDQPIRQGWRRLPGEGRLSRGCSYVLGPCLSTVTVSMR